MKTKKIIGYGILLMLFLSPFVIPAFSYGILYTLKVLCIFTVFAVVVILLVIFALSLIDD